MRLGMIDHASPLGSHNPTYYGYRRQITNAGRTISQLQIAEFSDGRCKSFHISSQLLLDTPHHCLKSSSLVSFFRFLQLGLPSASNPSWRKVLASIMGHITFSVALQLFQRDSELIQLKCELNQLAIGGHGN